MVEEFFSYLTEMNEMWEQNPEWRFGQAAFNTLHAKYPDLAEEISGTEMDPFYNDMNLPSFLTWVGHRLSEIHLQ